MSKTTATPDSHCCGRGDPAYGDGNVGNDESARERPGATGRGAFASGRSVEVRLVVVVGWRSVDS